MKTHLKRVAAGFSAALAISLGTVAPAEAAGITGTPASAAAAQPDMDPQQLEEALLTVADLPLGYRQLDFPAVLLDAVFHPHDSTETLWTASQMTRSGTLRPTGRNDAPAASSRLGKAATGRHVTPMQIGAFMQGETGPVLIQKIVATGEETAQEVIDTIESMRECCQVITSDDLRITLSELPMPRFGDASVAMSMTLTVKNKDFDLTLRGNMVALAYGDVYEQLVQVGAPETANDAQFTRIAGMAFDKLMDAYEIDDSFQPDGPAPIAVS
ncbi:F0F1-type ATP synthase membrane subunit c/vacuolar-type H+-ATPase subunit K [Actinoplanes campanulatus]|uniref:F0F1-type ATP synthase membrane subunit c/vacuolar-type H+-ATPase subunit K n=1 Tax=Actinoplanes campanulatus TaxID=113559 RepID=A0A7W5AG69_9ACTN|nr:hypothetical protein [Actinoplanes campanulatus]MBB3095451.1 F0F1-type ATP synthase membrane subunit c/vacuolar-type H+-ATPase subunit K [Actinoplanes campanulatus]GGN09108.1 hypothetical protein GCM10010109_18190 [Actinoplanes campanulatus]GID36337.1 hypothetical protein Aca09nite_28430 [Actinoplanes campanulatus]